METDQANDQQNDAVVDNDPDAVDPRIVDDLATIDPFIVVERLEYAIRRHVGQRRAECLADQGFELDLEAQSLSGPDSPLADRGIVSINPMELGPLNATQARTYGLEGMDTIFSRAQMGNVRSRDDTYDEAREKCDSQTSDAIDTELGSLLARSGELANEAASRFRQVVAPAIEPIILERLECFASRVGIPIESLASLESWPEIMEVLGVDGGHYLDDGPGPGEPDEGEILLIRPISPVYEPSDEEIEIAEMYAGCAVETRLQERLLAAQIEPRNVVLGEFADDLDELTKRLSDLVNELGDA